MEDIPRTLFEAHAEEDSRRLRAIEEEIKNLNSNISGKVSITTFLAVIGILVGLFSPLYMLMFQMRADVSYIRGRLADASVEYAP